MSKFFSLAKLQILNMISIMFGKKANKSASKQISIALLIIFAIAFAFGSMYLQIAQQLAQAGKAEYVFIQVGIVSILFIVMMVTFESHTSFFKSKDFEFLASLPLKPSAIVFAKFLTILTSAYLYTAITFIPGIAIYFIYAGFNVGIFFLLMLTFLLFPLLPTFISILIGLVSSFASTKVKNIKFLNFIFIFLFTGLYLLFSLNYQNIILFYVSKGADFISALVYVLPSLGLFMKGIFYADVLAMILFVLINIIAFALTIVLVSMLYQKINFALNKKVEFVSKKEASFVRKNTIVSLLKNEKERYFNIPIYLMNTIITSIIGMIAPLVLYFSNVFPVEMMGGQSLSLILMMIVSISMSGSNTACVSISIEGSKFQILKSLPISERKIIYSKILFNLIIVFPLSIISSILCVSLFHQSMDAVSAFAIFLVPLLSVFGSSHLGMIANLYFPKLKFMNYTQVVKQSASGFFGILGGLLFSALPFIIYFIFLSTVFELWLFMVLTITFFIVVDVLLFIFVWFKGSYLFKKIQC